MFATFTFQTANAIATTETFITDLEQQLQAARLELAQLQQQQQAEQTAKSAAETALEMVRKARKLVQVAYGDAAVKEFNRVLVEDEPVGELAPSAIADRTDEVEVEPSPEPSPNAPGDDPTTVTVAATVIEVDDSEAEEVGESQSENVPSPLDFGQISWTKLQKLAASKGVSVKGKRKDALQQALTGLVTQADIDQAA